MPAPGAVLELDEVNVFTINNVAQSAPPPQISITGPDAIRAGQTAPISWQISAPYATTCTVRGPGINETVVVNGVVGNPATVNGNALSGVLNNAARFEASCTVGSDVYTETYLVEIIPTFQEI